MALATWTLAWSDEIIVRPDGSVKAPGGRIRGQITSETPSEVKIKPATGSDQTIPVSEIESVTYDGLTASFTLAQVRENAGDLAEAAKLYRKAVGEASSKPLIAREAQYQEAMALSSLALADPGKLEAGIQALEAFVKDHGTGRQLGPALMQLARLQVNGADPKQAEGTLKTLAARVPWAASRVSVLEARLLAKLGKHEEALAAYEKLIVAAGTDAARARGARLAKAESLVALQRFDEAQKLVQEIIESAPAEDAEVQAEAHNTLGDCYRAAGRPKDALLAYLKTDLLYDRDKAEHPRALARIEELFRVLKRDKDADDVRERHKKLYPQSPYLKAK
jgi:tetratricopeptide (TPR) repeat protein